MDLFQYALQWNMVGIVIHFGHKVHSPLAALQDRWIIDEPKLIKYVNGFLHGLYLDRRYAKNSNMQI